MKIATTFFVALAAALLTAPVRAGQPTPQQQQAAMKKMEALVTALHPATGDVAIPQANAALHLGKDYYFLPPDQAKRVLVEGWGNPPDSVNDVLGMVFPAGKTFLDDTWGAVVTFEALGYVSDSDAQSVDYAQLLKQLQEGEADSNAARAEQGYPAQHLVGWAQQPVYDARTHSVVWAQNIMFEGSRENTLNYDIRLLGRTGVLSLNMVTGMSKLQDTRTAAEKLSQAASFNPGARYADYQPGVDKKAEFGIAGLVAAGVGAAAAKKIGLLGLILAFGKKFIILILAGLAAAGAWVKRRFLGGGEADDYGTSSPTYEEQPAFEPSAGSGEVPPPLSPGDQQETSRL